MIRQYILAFFLMVFTLGKAQDTGAIKGKVQSTNNEVVGNVNVGLVGTTLGTITDEDGNFEINNIQPGTYTISASYLGSVTQEKTIEVSAGSVSRINFKIEGSVLSLSEVTIVDERLNKFYKDSVFIVSKLPLKDLENPQVYNSVSSRLLKEQVVTNFNDAMRNATGVARLWESTGRGGDGAEYYSMRGFAVQPTLVNGMPSVNNAGLDPANIETIDVIKGPSGTLFGSPMISYGGLVNITTKKPYEAFGGEVGFVTGSNSLNRFTADINVPLNERAFARINSAYHSQNSFQDAGFTKSFFIAPSLTIKANQRLTFTVNTEFLSKESAHAPMIFLSRYSALTFNSIGPFEKNYKKSFTSNDLSIKNPSFGFQGQALYKISSAWTSQTVISRSNTRTNGYYHYLWDFSDGDTFGRYISKRNGETSTTDIQQNFIGDFKIGNLRNRMIIGVDYFKSNILNSSTGWALNGTVTFSNGEDTGSLTQAGVDNVLAGSYEGNSDAESEVLSAYVSDVINITPTLSAMASVRVDRFEGKAEYWASEEVKSQHAISPKLGLVYQPLKDKISVFANYLNGFRNVTPVEVSDINGNNPTMKTFDPEHANQWEAGVKTNIHKHRISASASYYHITVQNRVMADPTNVNNSIQGGEVESNGYEVSVIANPIAGLNLIAGFSDNHSEVTTDTPSNGYIGFRPEEAGPEQMVNFWASYTFQNVLKGLGVGFGGNSASEHKTLNREGTGTFALPAYTVLNSSLYYTSGQYSAILKVNNLTNEKYYSGWSTVTPQNLRNISISLNYKF